MAHVKVDQLQGERHQGMRPKTLVNDLRDRFDDMHERIKVNSGAQTFHCQLNGMLSESYPTLSLASAFNHFNWISVSYKRLGLI